MAIPIYVCVGHIRYFSEFDFDKAIPRWDKKRKQSIAMVSIFNWVAKGHSK